MKKIRILILISCVFLSGCSILPKLNPLTWFKGSSPAQERHYTYEEAFKIRPYLVYDKKGNPQCEKEIDYSYRTDWQQKDKELSWFKKFIRTFMQLGVVGIIIAVICVFFPPLAAFLGLAGRATEMGTRRIVNGLDKALDKVKDAESKKIIYETLSHELDPKTKMLVSKLKHKGNK